MTFEFIEFETLRKSDHDGPPRPTRKVITNAVELKNFYDLLDSERDIPLPSVDFETDMVVAVARGECLTEGYSVRIEDIIRYDGRLIAVVCETDPEEGVLQTCCYPYHLIRTQKCDGIEFGDYLKKTDF
ncbi:MAG: PrcB C-terminal [archaeon]|jgi:hypothetical protein